MTMDVRPVDTRDDVREAIRAHGRAWKEGYSGLLPEGVLDGMTVEPTSEDVDAWLERLPDDGGVTLVGSPDDAVRGYILLRWENTKPFVRPNEAGLKEIYVDPDWWGNGLGTALLDRACEHVPQGVEGIALEMLADNDIGRRFYEARGFEVDDHSSIEIADSTYETIIYRRM